MSIPGKNKQWSGCFEGNYTGDLWATFNMDLEKYKGRIALAPRMRRFSTTLGVVTKFIRTNATATDQWFGLCSGDILRNGSSTITAGTWISDDTTGTFNDPLDGVVHELVNGEQRLLVTRPGDIAILNKSGGANVWDNDWGSTVPATPIPVVSPTLTYRPIARLQRLVAIANKVTGVPKIDTIDKDDVVTLGALTFAADYTIKNIYASSNRFWIGLQHDFGGNAKVIEWDGTSLTYNNEYDLVGATPLCGFIVRDIPYFITDRGFVFKYTGGGFEKIQDFGLKEDEQILGLLSNYGAHVDDKIVYLNIGHITAGNFSSTAAPSGLKRLRPGIWIFNTENLNLYHHMGLGEYTTDGTDLNYGGIYGNTLSAGATIKTSDINVLVASASVYVGGATWQASQVNGIYREIRNDAVPSGSSGNRGYFITPFIPISEVEGIWEAIWIKFKRFVNSVNRIVVKWRVLDALSDGTVLDVNSNPLYVMQAPGTWVNTTSFTCKVPTGIVVGNEVEVLSGDNAGACFNISTLSATPDSTTLITVTISEAAPTSSTDTSLFRFDNWKTETAISSTTVGNVKVPFTATAHGEFIQLKIEFRGFDVEFDEVLPVFKEKTKANQT